MALRAMRPAAPMRPRLAEHVLSGGHRFEVRKSHTEPIAATVVKVRAWRDGSVNRLPSDHVR